MALWAVALALLLVVWVFRPDGGRQVPALLILRESADVVEGAVRELAATGRPVYVLDRGASDETAALLDRLSADLGIGVLQGTLAQAFALLDSPAVLVLRLEDREQAQATLRLIRGGAIGVRPLRRRARGSGTPTGGGG